MIDPIVAALRDHRERLGWTQEKLADEAGLSVHKVKEMERGRARRLDTIRAVAWAMGLDVVLMPHMVEVGAAGWQQETREAVAARREALRG